MILLSIDVITIKLNNFRGVERTHMASESWFYLNEYCIA